MYKNQATKMTKNQATKMTENHFTMSDMAYKDWRLLVFHTSKSSYGLAT